MPEIGELSQGATLMARLRTVSSEISGLLARVGNVGAGPPMTSMDRRRLADQAELSTASLAHVCAELDEWIAQGATGEYFQAAAAPVESAPGAEAETPRGTLADVSSAQETLDQARAHLHLAVESARAGGASWRQIGEALGIAGQTAHKRFDPRARRRHAAYMRERYQLLRDESS
ncbi:MAG: hypothetical protein ACR2OH_04760 [Microthrixaceae bacterium]